MPHVNSSGGDDFASSDEVKVYHDEGEEEKNTKESSENLSEDKLGLVTETESEKIPGQNYSRSDKNGPDSRHADEVKGVLSPHPADRGMCLPGGLFLPPYYHNGASVSPGLSGKMPLVPHSYPYSMVYPGSNEFQPPPAHMGIPPVTIDPKTGFARPMYPLPPPGQFPHPMYSPPFTDVQWPVSPSLSASALGSPYPPLISSPSLQRFSPHLLPPPHLHRTGMSHPAIITPGPRQEISGHHLHHMNQENHGRHSMDSGQRSPNHKMTAAEKKRNHIKKPLNAFMLFMKAMRAEVVAECTLKESAAINQILGRKWHALDRSEQAKYYEMARKEKELHAQLYPGWSARDNYAVHAKKKRRKKDQVQENRVDCTTPKKCRARYGLEQQTQWCKPCRSEDIGRLYYRSQNDIKDEPHHTTDLSMSGQRAGDQTRKKKCVRYMLGEDGASSDCDDDFSATDSLHDCDSDSNQGSPGPLCQITNKIHDNSDQNKPKLYDKPGPINHKIADQIHHKISDHVPHTIYDKSHQINHKISDQIPHKTHEFSNTTRQPDRPIPIFHKSDQIGRKMYEKVDVRPWTTPDGKPYNNHDPKMYNTPERNMYDKTDHMHVLDFSRNARSTSPDLGVRPLSPCVSDSPPHIDVSSIK